MDEGCSPNLVRRVQPSGLLSVHYVHAICRHLASLVLQAVCQQADHDVGQAGQLKQFQGERRYSCYNVLVLVECVVIMFFLLFSLSSVVIMFKQCSFTFEEYDKSITSESQSKVPIYTILSFLKIET